MKAQAERFGRYASIFDMPGEQKLDPMTRCPSELSHARRVERKLRKLPAASRAVLLLLSLNQLYCNANRLHFGLWLPTLNYIQASGLL